jgi:hypothetical protein
MIHIVGIDHMVQYNGPVPEYIRDDFRSFIVRVCRENQIDVIAEEFSEEALREVYQAGSETALEAAQLLGIAHRYCDPGSKELAELGIPYFADLIEEAKRKYNAPASYMMDREFREKITAYAAYRARSYWPIREKYWCDRLGDLLKLNILFICGHEHAERFKSFLLDRGHQCEIIIDFWEQDLFSDYANLGLA